MILLIGKREPGDRISPPGAPIDPSKWDEYDWQAVLNLCAARDLLRKKEEGEEWETGIPSLDHAWKAATCRDLKENLVAMMVAYVKTAETHNTIEMAEHLLAQSGKVIDRIAPGTFSKREWWRKFTDEKRSREERTIAAMVEAASYPILDDLQNSPCQREEILLAGPNRGKSGSHSTRLPISAISRAAAARIAEIDRESQNQPYSRKPTKTPPKKSAPAAPTR
ncbi:hypothetical protein [Streptomyces sp. WAC 01325]|uniref:hypothetical protein n=1 Tax=Streptomyces sp. WAC 01325 TaxID=2203202 RepID=UPI000F888E34|nr:hypothetical protein [Streptomyces sp. WAC 01325]